VPAYFRYPKEREVSASRSNSGS